MSHFYAEIKGTRGEATRGGDKQSGIRGHLRGWNIGARVVLRYNKETDLDEVFIYRTGGSNGCKPDELIAQFTEDK